MPKVSVIVAVYAAEKYLGRCLDSLLAQTLTEYEVLLIDDGSLDCSGNICDSYAAQDRRFKVFHKTNGGVASARQMGLSLASGEYVIHVDPDDWIEPEMLNDLYSHACLLNADLVICDFFLHKGDEKSYVCQKPQNLNSASVRKELFENLQGYCWNKLVKKSSIQRYGVSFKNNMVVWEDLLFCVELLQNSISVAYLPKAYYHYVRDENGNSLVDAVSKRKLDSMLFFIDYCQNKISDFDLCLLDEKKIEAKRTAFLINCISKKVFVETLSEVNSLFINGFKKFKKLDVLIRFALKRSWVIARILLFAWKMQYSLRRRV